MNNPKDENTTHLTQTVIDLAQARCPMAFVKARIALDRASPGDRIIFIFENHPANDPLSRSIEDLGHHVKEISSYVENPNTSNQNAQLSIETVPTITELKQMEVEVKKNTKE